MKKYLGLSLGILALIIVEFFIFKYLGDLKTGNKIQAGSITALVFLTAYYAIQTKKLAEEQKKSLREITNKRNIDFLETRLREFYCPFLNYFDEITNYIEKGIPMSFGEVNQFAAFITSIRDKEYMVFNSEIRKKIRDMIPVVQEARSKAHSDKEIKNKFLNLAKELREALINEREEIINQIQKFYFISEEGTGLKVSTKENPVEDKDKKSER